MSSTVQQDTLSTGPEARSGTGRHRRPATRPLRARLNACLPAHRATEPTASALYRLYRPVVFARCRRLLDSIDEAEDATQEVFIRVLKHLQAIPTGNEAAHWLHRTATNYCLNVIRDRKLRVKRTQEWNGDRSRSSATTGAASVDGLLGGHAEDAAVRRDIARRVLAALSPAQRPVAVLYYVDEMDQQEVADHLGISRRTVVNRLEELTHKRPRLRELD